MAPLCTGAHRAGTYPVRMRIATVNVNGIRAAARKGMAAWLEASAPDVLLLQEVRADADTAAALLPGYRSLVRPSRIRGRAGVGVAVREDGPLTLGRARYGVADGAEEPDVDSGRWLEALVEADGAPSPVRLVSAYFHSGEKDTPKQEAKMAHLPRIGARMAELLASAASGGEQAVVCGDFNVVRSRADIKNWTSNHNKRAGVLDEEIAFLNGWVREGWRDVVRDLAGQVQGPYSWWTWRGQAFDNDAGWRLDYQFATPGLARAARSFTIGRAPSYDQRFSAHAPVGVVYGL